MTIEDLHRMMLEALAEPRTLNELINALRAMPGYETTRNVRIERELIKLVVVGKVRREHYARMDDWRYVAGPHAVSGKRYRLRGTIEAWLVEREHPHIPGHWIPVVTGTEPEARKCLVALDPDAESRS